MKKYASIITLLSVGIAALGALPADAQMRGIVEFKSDRPAINSGMPLSLSWTGEGIESYKLYTFCSQGVSVSIAGKSSCNQVVLLEDATSAAFDIKNSGAEANDVRFELSAYDEFGTMRQRETLSVTVYAAAAPQITTLASFEANLRTVFSGSAVALSWTGTRVGRYDLSVKCPANVSFVYSEEDLCNTTRSFEAAASISVRAKNILEQSRLITMELSAYDLQGAAVEKGTLSVEVLPVKAKIRSFSLSSLRVPSRGAVTAYFEGENVEVFEFTVSCPRSTTVEGIQERIDLIRNHYAPKPGVSLVPKEELERCPASKTGPASLTRFSFRPWNPFKNSQVVTLEVRGNTLDGERRVLGDVQMKSVTVSPEGE